MAQQKARSIQNNQAVTKQVNVTDLTTSQKRELFISYLNQAGFVGFAKRKIDEQTHYIFTYETIK